MRKICVVCEVMHAPFDEGVRLFAAHLSRALAGPLKRRLLLISEKDSEVFGLKVHGALSNRYFLSRRLAELIGSFGPDAVIYVPWTSLTARTLVRVRALRRYAGSAPVAVVALQPRRADPLTRLVARLGGPDLVLVAGPGAAAQAAALKLRAERCPPGVDLARFGPAAPPQRLTLRQRAGIAPEALVVLHVGHMKASRNIAVMEAIARLEGVAAVMVASTSTVADSGLAERLAGAGVTLMTHHQDRIEFAYRLADVYLFPVTSALDAIETPLSVLEAAACDLAIVSTPFGGLPDLLDGGACWARTPEEMVDAVRRLSEDRAAGLAAGGTRRFVEHLGWDAVAGRVVGSLEGLR